jgi:starvation-inducible outer membrane lipoprotein
MKKGIVLGMLFLMSGCSSISEKMGQWSAQAVAKTSDVIYPIEVKQQGDMAWVLTQQYDEPPVLDGFQMDYKARELCPTGYLKDEVYAKRPALFAKDHAQCVTADCRYTLVWKIHCEETPQEPFSIFGKF